MAVTPRPGLLSVYLLPLPGPHQLPLHPCWPGQSSIPNEAAAACESRFHAKDRHDARLMRARRYTQTTYGTAPPKTTYAPHTHINGSRSSFVVVCVIAGLVFFALLGGGWWFLRRRRRIAVRRRSGVASASAAKTAGGRRSMGGSGQGAGAWGRLGDHEDDDDPFAAAPSANVSMVDLNDPQGGRLSPELGKGSYSRAYAASGESINWPSGHTELPTLGKHNDWDSRDEADDDDAPRRTQRDAGDSAPEYKP